MQGDWTVSALRFRINLTTRRRRIRILLTILESFIVYPPDRTPSVDTLEIAASLSVYSFLLGFPWHETKEFHILELTCELEMKVTWELSGKITPATQLKRCGRLHDHL
jgi:hypothetical protein